MSVMHIVIAPDKFKGCLSAADVADAMAAGVALAAPDATIDRCPIADGGEGFVNAMVRATGGRLVSRRVTGPLPDIKFDAHYGILGDGKTAVIEMAAAAGLALLKPGERNPMATTTFGVGELMREAIEGGCRKILLGIGGSATVDGGLGCAQATGHTIVLQDGEPVSPNEPLVGRDLERVVMIKRHRGEVTDGVEIVVACDVTNPLFGPTGAAAVFGPQKGATPNDVQLLDGWLRGLAIRTGKETEANTPGAGAAGGLGFGLMAYFGAKLVSGIDLVVESTGLRKRLEPADLCLTGEGRLDGQSADGKTISGIAKLCKELGVPCVALAGSIGEGAEAIGEHGVTAYFSICDRPMSLEKAMRDACSLLQSAAANVVRMSRKRI